MLEEALGDADFVLIMSVNPGFGGQKFIPSCLEKVRRLKRTITERSLDVKIEIDGGIGSGNIAEVVEAGAEIIVAGSAVYGSGDPAASVKELLESGTVWV
jgi:ribulose-phosphate 3-epimerase